MSDERASAATQAEPEPKYRYYITQPSESLAGIALRELKDGSRWVEIRDLNEYDFPDMRANDYYPVGTQLRLPAAAPVVPPVALPALTDDRAVLIKNAHTLADWVHRSDDGPIEALHIAIDKLPAVLPAQPPDERHAFDAHWRAFTSDGNDTERDVRIANFAAWHAWMARAAVSIKALDELRAAIAFTDQVRAAPDSEKAGSGAWRDAREWVEKAARALLAQPVAQPEPDSTYEQRRWLRELFALIDTWDGFREGTSSKHQAFRALWTHAHNIGPNWHSRNILAASAAPAPEQPNAGAEQDHLAGNRNEAPCGDKAVEGSAS